MQQRTLPCCVTAVWLIFVFSLPGCDRSTPKVDVAESHSTSGDGASDGGRNRPAEPLAAAQAAANTLSRTASPSGTVTPPAPGPDGSPSPLSIGPGYFHGSREMVVSHSARIQLLAFSPDRCWLASADRQPSGEGTLQIWDIATGRIVTEIFEPHGITAVRFAPDSQTLAYAVGDSSLVLQPLPSGPPRRLSGHRFSIVDLDFSPQGGRIASVAHDNRLILWDVRPSVAAAEVKFDKAVRRVRFAGPERLWIWGEGGVLQWYRIEAAALTRQQELQLPETGAPVAAAEHVIYVAKPDQSLARIETTTGKELPPLTLDKSPPTATPVDAAVRPPRISAIAAAEKSHDVAVCKADGTLTLWKKGEPSARQSWNLMSDDAYRLAVDPQGRRWAVAADRGILIFDREQPDSPQWLEQPVTEHAHLPAPRFGSNGDVAVSTRDHRTIVLSSIETGRTLRRLVRPDSANNQPLTALYVANGNIVTAGTAEGRLERWPAHQPDALRRPGIAKAAMTVLAETRDGKWILAGAEDGSLIWMNPAETSSSVRRQEHTAGIRALTLSNDERWAATASDDHSIVLWDVTGQKRLQQLTGHAHPVQAVAFSPDDRILFSGDRQGTIIAWKLPSGKQSATFSLELPLLADAENPQSRSPVKVETKPSTGRKTGISALAVSRDGRVLAVGTAAGDCLTFDLPSRRKLSMVSNQESITDLAFAADGASLLAASRSGEISRRWRALAEPQRLSGHQGSVRFVALDAHGRRAVTGGHDKRLCVWDLAQAAIVQSLPNEGEVIVAGALSADGQRAVTGGYGSGIVFWDLAKMKRLRKRYGHAKRITSLAFSPDGKFVASACEDQTVKIWDFATQKTLHTMTHEMPVSFVAFSPDGSQLVTSTLNPRGWRFPAHLQLWDAATGKRLSDLHGHRAAVNAAVFTPNGRRLISCGADGQLCVWNQATGRRIDEVFARSGLSHPGLIQSGRMLVMRRFANGVMMYEADSRQKLGEFDVPTKSVTDLDVAPLGDRIIVGTEEGAAYVWSIGHE